MGAAEDAMKQAEEAMKQAQALAKDNPYAQAAYAEAQGVADARHAQAAELDPNAPEFQPIDGVSYDDYVKLCVNLQPAGTDTAKQEELAVANGLTKEKWKTVSEGFTKRCLDNQVFALRLGNDVMAAGKG